MKKLLRLVLIVFAAGLLAGIAAVWLLGRPYRLRPARSSCASNTAPAAAAIASTLKKAGVVRYEWQIWAARCVESIGRACKRANIGLPSRRAPSLFSIASAAGIFIISNSQCRRAATGSISHA